MTETLLLFKKIPAQNKCIGLATLNSEKTLNALNLEMIESLFSQLKSWEEDPEIALVFLQAKGRAFCAGGDIRSLYDSMKAGDQRFEEFFAKEYQLDYAIHQYSKPFIVWGGGIVMGGGMGLMQGASHRIVSENTKMAMPEITIGLFPDVGASYFLRQCPRMVGKFLAASGVRLNAAECLFAKLADHFISQERKESFLQELQKCEFTGSQDEQLVDKVITSLREDPPGLINNLLKHESFVKKVATSPSPQELISWLKDFQTEEKWELILQKAMLQSAPSSLGLVFEQFLRSKEKSLKECFEMEWVMACQCCLHPDFQEGIRALLVDKDHAPRWSPESVDKLTADHLNEFFQWPEKPLSL